MLDLEQAIADWRKQMLAAGIKTPAPLEELEIHLREEIERQIKSGIEEERAFAGAVARVGPADSLKTEFERSRGFLGWLAGRFASIPCNIMIKNHPVSFGAVIGMLMGILIFAVGNSLTPDYLLLKGINVVQSPLIPVVNWIQGPSHGWGPDNAGIYKLLLVMMGYWALIGLLAGFGCRLVFGRKFCKST
jgi:hypothetical protein